MNIYLITNRLEHPFETVVKEVCAIEGWEVNGNLGALYTRPVQEPKDLIIIGYSSLIHGQLGSWELFTANYCRDKSIPLIILGSPTGDDEWQLRKVVYAVDAHFFCTRTMPGELVQLIKNLTEPRPEFPAPPIAR